MNPHLSVEQEDFMQLQRASRFAPCRGAGVGSVYVYREDGTGTCRWLIDRAAHIFQFEYLSFGIEP